MRQTTRCVACQTQISVGEPTCWACGVVQARPAPPPPVQSAASATDPYHRPCPRCRHSVALYHLDCRNCGFHLGRSSIPLPVDLPSGWEATPLADGSVQLKRIGWNRISLDGELTTCILLGAFYLLVILAGSHHRYSPRITDPMIGIFDLLFLIGIVAAATVSLIWLVFGSEQWHLAPNHLEIQKECLGRKWGPTFAHAQLSIRTEWHSSGRSRRRVCVLRIHGGRRRYVLAQVGLNAAVNLEALGRYVSEQTGWPLEMPYEWPPSPGFWGLW